MKERENCRIAAVLLYWGKADPGSLAQSSLRFLNSVILEQSSALLKACSLSSAPISLELWFSPPNTLLCTTFQHSIVSLKSSENYTCSLQTNNTAISWDKGSISPLHMLFGPADTARNGFSRLLSSTSEMLPGHSVLCCMMNVTYKNLIPVYIRFFLMLLLKIPSYYSKCE